MAQTPLGAGAPGGLLLLLSVATASLSFGSDAQVAILHAAEWSPGDSAREGAGEFLILLRAAQLQHVNRAAALVTVADQPGALRAGAERALHRVALTGVVVAKIARNGDVAWTPDQLFVDAGNASPDRAQRVLKRGLELFGAVPMASDPDHPTGGEIAAIRQHLAKFQVLFAREMPTQIALR
jgi:hypothetical protein